MSYELSSSTHLTLLQFTKTCPSVCLYKEQSVSEIQFRLLSLTQCCLYVVRRSLTASFCFYGVLNMNIINSISELLFLFLDKPFWISAVTGGEGVPENANVSSKILLPNAIVFGYIVRCGL